MSYLFNRIANSANQFQGSAKRVLCVCSAGLLRSPTTAVILSQEPYNYNTRAAGIVEDFALIPVDEVLLNWAQEIVCMNKNQKIQLESMLKEFGLPPVSVINLDIPDSFAYRDPKLMELIRTSYNAALETKKTDEKVEQESV